MCCKQQKNTSENFERHMKSGTHVTSAAESLRRDNFNHNEHTKSNIFKSQLKIISTVCETSVGDIRKQEKTKKYLNNTTKSQ